MVWIPDHVWAAQSQQYAKGKSWGGCKGRRGASGKGSLGMPGKGSGSGASWEWQMMQQVMKGGGAWSGGWSGKSKGKGSAQKKAAAQGQHAKKKGDKAEAVDLAWKSRLNQAYAKLHKAALTKDNLVYTIAVEGDGFIASLSSDKFTNVYASETVCDSRKLAEESVAMVALEAEFPDVFEAVPDEVKAAGASASAVMKDEALAKAGDKRKAGQRGVGGQDPKSRLNAGLMIVIGRPIAKGEIAYTTVEHGSSTVATVGLHCLEEPKEFTGEAASGTSKESKKIAEANAAEVAYEAFEAQIEEKRPEHEARKAEKQAAFEARVEEYKASQAS